MFKFKNFEIRKHSSAKESETKFEVVKWYDDAFGKRYCYVIAFIRWNEREPCWQFDCVGMRFIDDYEEGLCEFIKEFMSVLYVAMEVRDE